MQANRCLAAALALASLTSSAFGAEEVLKGHHAKVEVTAATRLDWVFPLANQSSAEPPAEWLAGYDSTKQSFELFVPKNYTPKKAWPVVLFISPGDQATGWPQWQEACEKLGVIFVSPHASGNNCPMPRRVRIVMDALDDVRRRYRTDPDRTYIGGFSGGGRVACSIAFAVPEYFGGVVPVCAAGDLREESWLRQRVVDRLSVAHVTGESDFNRGEVERFRGPMLGDVGVRSKVWVQPKMGHGVPSGAAFVEVLKWLDDGAKDRAAFAKKWPASRIAGDDAPSREEWAKELTAEARKRIGRPETIYSGLMQLSGVRTRWADLPQAKQATEILTEHDNREARPWERDDVAEQRRFLIARARRVDAYASGDLPDQYKAQRTAMLTAAKNLWQQVLEDGQDEKAVAEGRVRIDKIDALLKGESGS